MPAPRFDNRYADLPADLWSRQAPSPLRNPRLLSVNLDLAARLGLDADWLSGPEGLAGLAGAAVWPGSDPLAMKYGGHQFGGWNPDLGDGRGLLLGQLQTPDGLPVDLHLKGSGPTPWSRMGDGRAVLRSSIREYLAGEALHALGIPTTRALALVGSDTRVQREKTETAATLLRTAGTHIRFGHFEWLAHSGRTALLPVLADHVIARHFPDCQSRLKPYEAMFVEVVQRTARLMADWQRVGFAHGVMNTDNFSIVGETLDFGPYGFLERYDPYHICNHSDHNGRYAWYLQPSVGLWNLNALAHALVSLIPVPALKEILAQYEPALTAHYDAGMAARLGLVSSDSGDRVLVQDLLSLLQQAGADLTLSFRRLSENRVDDLLARCETDWPGHAEAARNWLQRYRQRLLQDALPEAERQRRMQAVNPLYVLRNYLCEIAIKAAEEGLTEPLETLREVVSNPYVARPEWSGYAGEAPAWGRCLAISCSS